MRKILCILMASLMAAQAFAQADRHEVRAGNRKFRRGDYKEAEIDYRKALLKDSLSLAGNYNLAGDLYRMERYDEAGKALETIKSTAPDSKYAADYWYNKGAAELQCKYLPLINALFSEVNPIPVKAAMAELGFCENFLRMPLTPMEEDHKQKLFALMREEGLI